MSNRRISANAAALVLGRVLAAGSTIFVSSLSAHRLTTREFGLVVTILAAGFLANTMITFGTDTVVTRAVASGDEDVGSTTKTSLALQLAASAGLVLLTGIGALLGLFNSLLFIQALALVPMAVTTVAGAVLRGREQMTQLLWGSLAAAVVTSVIVVVGFAQTRTPTVPIVAHAAGALAGGLVLLWLVRSDIAASTPRIVAPVALAREAAPFAGMVIWAAIGSQAGLLLVEAVTDDSAGGFSAGVRVTEAARLFPAAVVGALFPSMVSRSSSGVDNRRWLQLLLAYAVAAVAAIAALAPVVNEWVFDTQPDGAALIRILSVGLIFTVVRLVTSFELIAVGHERSVFISAVLGSLVSIGLGIVAGLQFGPQGLAWAHVLGIAASAGYLVRHKSTLPPL